MKTLANCTPKEFFVQTNKIRKSVEIWLKDTNILGIRARKPDFAPMVKEDMTKDELAEAINKRKEAFAEQAKRNAFDMIEAAMEKYPDETIEIMALVCFIEPSEANNYPMSEYLANITEIISDKAVLDFFMSLASLGVSNTSTTATGSTLARSSF